MDGGKVGCVQYREMTDMGHGINTWGIEWAWGNENDE